MTILIRWLLIPIIALIIFLFWKGSSLVIKSTLLIVPLIGIIGWFAHEGAFNGSGGLAKIYGLITLALFLVCYEIGMLIDRFYLVKKNISTTQNDILLVIGLTLLIVSIVYFLILVSK